MNNQEQAISMIQKLAQKLVDKEIELVSYEAALEEVQAENEQLKEVLADVEEMKKKLEYYDELAARAQDTAPEKTK